MNYFKVILLSLILLTVCSCNSDKRASSDGDLSEKQQDSTRITRKDIAKFKYVDYGLSNTAKGKISDWQQYQELSTQMEFLKQGDLSFFSGNDSLVKAFVNDLRADAPAVINNPIVKARLTAFETKALKLNSIISLNGTTKKELLTSIEDVLITVSVLNLQINKKFELDANNINKPL